MSLGRQVTNKGGCVVGWERKEERWGDGKIQRMNQGRYKEESDYDLMMLSKLKCAPQPQLGYVLEYYKRNNEFLV
jgi:hypothetical protein